MTSIDETKIVPRIRSSGEITEGAVRRQPESADAKTVRISIPRARKSALLDSPDDQYSIMEKIGDGGMGVVFLARDRKLGRYVAIKRLHKASMSRPALRERFMREAKVVATLNHVHIVKIFGLGEDEDGPYIVMEYVAGPQHCSPDKTPASPFSLTDRVHRDGPFSLNDALDFVIKLAKAVDYAHSCGVIHRDLKPSNVLLDSTGEPKIVDFGLARITGPEEEQITVPGEKMLSIGYGAPEQEVDVMLADERSDVYGLGALLYFSITGQNPRYFRENSVPDALRIPIVKALETDRTKRWSSVRDFYEALLPIKAPSSVVVPITKATWRCKWCDTVNPIALRFCGRCGWDGGVSCHECGAGSRVGVQFCVNCGADARDYEGAMNLLDRLRQLMDEKAFDLVPQYASKAAGFNPIGRNGAKMIEEITRLRDQAHKSMARSNQLRQEIKEELAAENYERAREHVDEYNSLSLDIAFARDLRDLPSRILKRDIKRVEIAIKERNYNDAARTCHAILSASPGNAEARRLLSVIRWERIVPRVRKIAVTIIVLFLLYMLSGPPVFRLVGNRSRGVFDIVYGPARVMSSGFLLRYPMDKYCAVWRAKGMLELPLANGETP